MSAEVGENVVTLDKDRSHTLPVFLLKIERNQKKNKNIFAFALSFCSLVVLFMILSATETCNPALFPLVKTVNLSRRLMGF